MRLVFLHESFTDFFFDLFHLAYRFLNMHLQRSFIHQLQFLQTAIMINNKVSKKVMF